MKNAVNNIRNFAAEFISMIREAKLANERREARRSTKFTVYTFPMFCRFTNPAEDVMGLYYIDREKPFSEVCGQAGII